jgi:Transcriptional regulator
METVNLKTFLALAQCKNFTRTARQLFVAQSTVTNRISELENELGCRLFLRSNKNVSLTNEGISFVEYAQRILDLEEMSVQELHSVRSYDCELRIGTTNIIYECLLLPEIQDQLEHRPDLAFKIKIDHSGQLLNMLKDNALDIIFGFLPFQMKGYLCKLLEADPLILVTSPGHNAFPGGVIKRDLSGLDYVFCNLPLQELGNSVRELFPPHFQFRFEISDSSKLVPLLLSGTGYSFLPQSLVKKYLDAGRLANVPLLDFSAPNISYYCIYKPGNPRVAKSNFLEHLPGL